MKNNELVEILWRPESYSRLSIAQNESANRLLKVLKISNDSVILDVGCGDGQISAKLAKTVPNGSVIGLDKSAEMIKYATNIFENTLYPNLDFFVLDAQLIDFKNKFDLVFSSFALQWIDDKNLVFKKAYEALKANGQLALIIPLAVSAELEQATKATIEKSIWCGFFKNFHPNWYFVTSKSIIHLAKENNFQVNYTDTYTIDVNFPSIDDLKEYILLWFPYLTPLTEDQKSIFFSQVIESYCNFLPPKNDGSISMKIPVLSLIASKNIAK